MFDLAGAWVAGGCWDDKITSDDWDHSRKFPAFSTSKLITRGYYQLTQVSCSTYQQVCQVLSRTRSNELNVTEKHGEK